MYQKYAIVAAFVLIAAASFGAPGDDFRVVSPNGGEHFLQGHAVTISWDMPGGSAHRTEIRLSTDGGQSYPYRLVELVDSPHHNELDGTATRTWRWMNTSFAGSNLRIKVSATYGDVTVTDASDNDFTIGLRGGRDVPRRHFALDSQNGPADQGDKSTILADANQKTKSGSDAEVALAQNYPNPFNPSTEIAFDLAEQGSARLAVYNLLGQTVATLANGDLTAGHHSFSFDASHLPSGLYVYRLDAAGQSLTRPMMLTK